MPGSGRSSGEGNGNPLQYSCLGNPMHRGAWRATVHGFAESDLTKQLTHKHKFRQNKTSPVHFTTPAMSLILKIDKDTIKKENHRPS